MILKPTPEMPEQAQKARKRSSFSIGTGSQASSPISKVITASNANTEFEIISQISFRVCQQIRTHAFSIQKAINQHLSLNYAI